MSKGYVYEPALLKNQVWLFLARWQCWVYDGNLEAMFGNVECTSVQCNLEEMFGPIEGLEGIWRKCFDAICRECLAMLGVRLYDGNLEGMFGPIGG